MKVFIIQPNWHAPSEVWLHRMNEYLKDQIEGVAAFFHDHVDVVTGYPVFNLSGRMPTFYEGVLSRLKIKQYSSKGVMQVELCRFIEKSGADILLTHFLSTAVYVKEALEQIHLPMVIHVHGPDVIWEAKDEKNNSAKYFDSKYIDDCRHLINSKNVKLIANSEFSRNQLLNIGVDNSKIALKYFGVPDVKKCRNFNKEYLTVLYLGRFVDFKGPDVVLMAFIEACKRGFRGNLIMAGDGHLKPFCQLIASRSEFSNRITFIGAVDRDEAADLYANADIYTMHNCKGFLSDQVEAFGVSIIEAMSYGLPVITGESAGPKEIIETGVDGILVEPGNIDAHADALMKLYRDRAFALSIGQNAVMKVENKFSREQEKVRLEEILTQHLYLSRTQN